MRGGPTADRSFGGQLAAALIVALALALLGASWLYGRSGRGAAEVEMARLVYTQANRVATEVERTLTAQGTPGRDTQQYISRAANDLDASIVLFLDADEPLVVAHGPSLTPALPRLERAGNGISNDSGVTPWEPRFGDPPDPDRFPRREERLVRVQQDWPFAVEMPVGVNLSLRVVPLSVLPLSDGGFRSSLFVLFIVLALSAVLAALRLARPVEATAVALERLASGGEQWTGPSTSVREFAWMARAGQRMAQRIRDAKVQQRELLKGLGRILVDPVAQVKKDVESISGEHLPADDRERLARAESGVGAVHRAATALWQWSALEAGTLEPELAERDLRSFVAEVVRLFRERRAPDLFIEVDVADTVDETVRMDSRLMAGVLASLLDNVRDHGTGPARVEVHRGHTKIEVLVQDQGGGVPPEELADLFQPLRTGRATGGLGLGLRVARLVVSLHGGGLSARNLVVGGFEGSFWLPAPPVRVSAVDRSLQTGSQEERVVPVSQTRPRSVPAAPVPTRPAPEPPARLDEMDPFEP